MIDYVVYIIQKGYLREMVANSLPSFRRFLPDATYVIITPDEDFPTSRWYHIQHIPQNGELWFQYTLRATRDWISEHEQGTKVLFLDSDTYACGNFTDIEDVLEVSPICVAHAPGRHTADTINPVPAAFAEFNIGVMGIKVCEVTLEVFQAAYYMGSHRSDVYGDNDQAPLREAMFKLCFAPVVLPPEYNLRFGFGCFAKNEVKILHGRTKGTYQELAETVNKMKGFRVWKPGELA